MAENRAAFSLRRRRSLGFSKCRWFRTTFNVPSRSIFFLSRRRTFSTDSPFLSLISVNTFHFLSKDLGIPPAFIAGAPLQSGARAYFLAPSCQPSKRPASARSEGQARIFAARCSRKQETTGLRDYRTTELTPGGLVFSPSHVPSPIFHLPSPIPHPPSVSSVKSVVKNLRIKHRCRSAKVACVQPAFQANVDNGLAWSTCHFDRRTTRRTQSQPLQHAPRHQQPSVPGYGRGRIDPPQTADGREDVDYPGRAAAQNHRGPRQIRRPFRADNWPHPFLNPDLRERLSGGRKMPDAKTEYWGNGVLDSPTLQYVVFPSRAHLGTATVAQTGNLLCRG